MIDIDIVFKSGTIRKVRTNVQSGSTPEQDAENLIAAISQLVTFLEPVEPTGARGGLAPWQKRKVDQYLRQNLDRPLRLHTVAEQVALSVSHFSRAFKESFGTTPHMHTIRLRLELAQQLMLTTKDPLSQIAVTCGLADQAHLSKLFRRMLGDTPSAWRRRNLTDTQAEALSGGAERSSQGIRHGASQTHMTMSEAV